MVGAKDDDMHAIIGGIIIVRNGKHILTISAFGVSWNYALNLNQSIIQGTMSITEATSVGLIMLFKNWNAFVDLRKTNIILHFVSNQNVKCQVYSPASPPILAELTCLNIIVSPEFLEQRIFFF